jgi:hypothetical protein
VFSFVEHVNVLHGRGCSNDQMQVRGELEREERSGWDRGSESATVSLEENFEADITTNQLLSERH